jgi:hypothetical protein
MENKRVYCLKKKGLTVLKMNFITNYLFLLYTIRLFDM